MNQPVAEVVHYGSETKTCSLFSLRYHPHEVPHLTNFTEANTSKNFAGESFYQETNT